MGWFEMSRKRVLKISLILMVFSLGLLNIGMPRGEINNSSSLEITNFTPYKFIVLGDTRPEEGDNTGLETLVDIIDDVRTDHQIEFILHSGDVVEHGADQSDWDTYYWSEMSDIANEIPIYYAIGNHEYYTTASGGYTADLLTFRDNVELPGNEMYFSFTSPQNDTKFIVLNSVSAIWDSPYYNYDLNATRAAEQRAWLENDLENNSYDRTIVLTHMPMWGINPSDDRLKPIDQLNTLWHPLFVDNDVDMVISGHAHTFYQTVRNGTDYTTSGGGTIDFVGSQPNHPIIQERLLPEDRIMLEEIHLLLIEATIEGFDVKVITADQSVAFEYQVPAVLTLDPTTTTTTTASSLITTTTTTTSTTPVGLLSSLVAFTFLIYLLKHSRKCIKDT